MENKAEIIKEMKPLILFIEDREELRRDCADLLKESGCLIISVDNAKDAIKNYMISPNIDLVFTDIDLLGRTEKDKSGVDIAKFVKQVNCDLPIIGYSSKFEENELTNDEREYFDEWYSKGRMNLKEITHMLKNVKEKANGHKMERFDEMCDLFNTLKKKDVIDNNAFGDILRLAIKYDSAPFSQIDEAINDIGYKLVLIDTDSYKNMKTPILIWLREDDNLCEAEVYGYSDLYSFGDTKDEAINSLFVIMLGFYEDLKEDMSEKISGPALKLQKFLFNVFDY